MVDAAVDCLLEIVQISENEKIALQILNAPSIQEAVKRITFNGEDEHYPNNTNYGSKRSNRRQRNENDDIQLPAEDYSKATKRKKTEDQMSIPTSSTNHVSDGIPPQSVPPTSNGQNGLLDLMNAKLKDEHQQLENCKLELSGLQDCVKKALVKCTNVVKEKGSLETFGEMFCEVLQDSIGNNVFKEEIQSLKSSIQKK